MKFFNFLRELFLNFLFVFILLVVVMYLYNQIAYGITLIQWNKILIYTVILGLIFTFTKWFNSKKKIMSKAIKIHYRILV